MTKEEFDGLNIKDYVKLERGIRIGDKVGNLELYKQMYFRHRKIVKEKCGECWLRIGTKSKVIAYWYHYKMLRIVKRKKEVYDGRLIKNKKA